MFSDLKGKSQRTQISMIEALMLVVPWVTAPGAHALTRPW